MKCLLIFTVFVASAITTSVVCQQVIHHHHHRFVAAGGPQHSHVRYVVNPQQQASATSQGHPGHGHGHHHHPGNVQYSVVHSQSPSPVPPSHSHSQVQPAQQRVSTVPSSSELDAKKIHEQFVAAFQAQQRLAHSLPPQQQIQHQLAPSPSASPAPVHAVAAAGRGVPVGQQVQGYPQPQVVQYFVRHTPARIVNSYQHIGQYQTASNGVKSQATPLAAQQQQQQQQEIQAQSPQVVQQQPQFLVSPRPTQYPYAQSHPLLLAQPQPQPARAILGPSVAPYLQPQQIVHHHHVPQQPQHFPVQITQHAYSGVQPGVVTQFAPQPQQYSQAISAAAIRNVNQVAVNKVVTPVVTKASTAQTHAEPAIAVGKVQGFAHSTSGPGRVADVQFNTAYTAFSRPIIGQNGPVAFSAPIDTGAGSGGRVGADAILSLFRNGGLTSGNFVGGGGVGPTSPSLPVATHHHHHAQSTSAGQVTFSQIIPQQPTRVTLTGGGDEIESVPKLENIQVYQSPSLQLQNYQNYQQQVQQQLEFQQIEQQRQEQQQQQQNQQYISAAGPPPPSSYYTIRHHAVPQIDGLSPLPALSDNRLQSEVSSVSAAASAVAQSQASQAHMPLSLQELTSDILSSYNLK